MLEILLIVAGFAVVFFLLCKWRKRLMKTQYRRLDEICRRDGVDLPRRTWLVYMSFLG